MGNQFLNLQNPTAEKLRKLSENFKCKPHEWENKSIDQFLEAMAAWIDDCDGYFKNANLPLPHSDSLNFVLDCVTAAKHYE